MLTLFSRYINEGKIPEALMIGRNSFNRDPQNKEVFCAYYDLLCSLAESLPALDDRRQFAEQASITLSFFTENADMSEELLDNIMVFQKRLDDVFVKLQEEQAATETAQEEKLEVKNRTNLAKLSDIGNELRSVKDQKGLDKLLSELAQLDADLDQDAFTPEQREYYDIKTKEFSELISETMRVLEREKNLAYNKKAAESFKKAFEMFRGDEGKYKSRTQLFSLVSSTLFGYDASRLFNETLIYYNHVYSYIFSKLDDDGKFALTKYSIECERKLR